MTMKQYMKFEDFKKEFLLEAKKGRFPVGLYWSFHRDPNDSSNKKKGIMDFYVALDKKIADKLKNNHNAAIDEIIKKIKTGTQGIKFNTESTSTISHNFDDDYSLKRVTIPFEFTSMDTEAENLTKIRQYVKSTLKPYTEKVKVYTSSELKDYYGKPFESREDAEDKAVDYIDNMINHPEKFGGYKSITQHLDDIKDMSMMEFIHQYASDGPLEALVAKLIFNGINKWRDSHKEKKDKKAHPPKWNDNLKDFLTIQNKEGQIDLSTCIENYDLHKDNIEILLSPESTTDEYKIDGTLFKYKFKEIKEYIIKFTLRSKKNKFNEEFKTIKINVTVPKWNNNLDSFDYLLPPKIKNSPTDCDKINPKVIDLTKCIDNYNLVKDDIEISIEPVSTDPNKLCTIEGTTFKFKWCEPKTGQVKFKLSSKSNSFDEKEKRITINVTQKELQLQPKTSTSHPVRTTTPEPPKPKPRLKNKSENSETSK